MTGPFVLGLDIGGTKLAAGVSTLTGEVLGWQLEPTRREEGPMAVMARLIDMGRWAIADAGVPLAAVKAVGIGCGSPLNRHTGVVQSPSHLPDWVDVPVTQMVTDALGLPAYLDNDANAAALGEHRFGAGKGVQNMVYLTVSTGIGGGVILDGRLWLGQRDAAGEIGHTSVIWNGRPCGCGRRGCLEAYASGTGIAARAREAVLGGEPSVLTALAGDVTRLTAEHVVAAARQGDPVAVRLWDETLQVLAAGIANAANTLAVELVVLGGGVTRAGDALFEPVRRLVTSQLFRPLPDVVTVVPARLGDQVGVLGAAAVALDRLAL